MGFPVGLPFSLAFELLEGGRGPYLSWQRISPAACQMSAGARAAGRSLGRASLEATPGALHLPHSLVIPVQRILRHGEVTELVCKTTPPVSVDLTLKSILFTVGQVVHVQHIGGWALTRYVLNSLHLTSVFMVSQGRNMIFLGSSELFLRMPSHRTSFSEMARHGRNVDYPHCCLMCPKTG